MILQLFFICIERNKYRLSNFVQDTYFPFWNLKCFSFNHSKFHNTHDIRKIKSCEGCQRKRRLVRRYSCGFTQMLFLRHLILINPKTIEFLFELNEREVHWIMVFYSQKFRCHYNFLLHICIYYNYNYQIPTQHWLVNNVNLGVSYCQFPNMWPPSPHNYSNKF